MFQLPSAAQQIQALWQPEEAYRQTVLGIFRQALVGHAPELTRSEPEHTVMGGKKCEVTVKALSAAKETGLTSYRSTSGAEV